MLTFINDLIQLRHHPVLLLRLSVFMKEEGMLGKTMPPYRVTVPPSVIYPQYYSCCSSGFNS
jgi:hypothetical protein